VSEPPFKIRKYIDGWHVQQRVNFRGHLVWGFIGVFQSWEVAFAVVQVSAGMDGHPYFKEAK
jgi:hypothetical protein